MGYALLGRKLGMTQLFLDDGRCVGVTVIQAGPCPVVQLKTVVRDGYEAIQIGFEPSRGRVSRPVRGHFEAADLQPHRVVAEVARSRDAAVGDVLTVVGFTPGSKVDLSGVSKGKGFAGLHKRHNFGRGPVTHGSHNIRQPGSVGSVDAARTWRGLRMAGHLGAVRRTVSRLEVLRVDVERNLLLVKGAVPGAKGEVVVIRESASRIRKVRGQR